MRRRLIAILVMSAAIIGCADHRAWTRADAWHKPQPPDVTTPSDARTVPFAQVKPSARGLAERQLIATDCIILTPQAAASYLDEPLHTDAGDQLFLVRGLCLSRETGRFDVHFDGDDLYIVHSSLGRGPVPMRRQPLVVALPARPRQVYVTVRMAE